MNLQLQIVIPNIYILYLKCIIIELSFISTKIGYKMKESWKFYNLYKYILRT